MSTMASYSLPPWRWPRAAYVHVPFCVHHCGYCDFAIAVGQDHLVDTYLDALTLELATLGRPQPVNTISLGGGTPSLLSCRQLERLLTTLHHWLPLAPDGEFSIEVNPDTLDPAKVAVLADHGINRVSLGAQSFRPPLLQMLDRRHSAEQVPTAVEWVRRRIENFSIDLIFGVPGQTMLDWEEDLARVLVLEPTHVSTYGLTYEKGTPLWKRRERGEVVALPEEYELELYSTAIDTLEWAGFEHYEISNFARPGRRSRHNQTYWANEAYFGFGMGAARYVLGRRELNTRDLRAYLQKILAGEVPTFQSEELTAAESARETMAIQLRRVEGIERLAFLTQTGYALDTLAGPAIRQHVELELLSDDGRRVTLTRRGKYLADAVIERLLGSS